MESFQGGRVVRYDDGLVGGVQDSRTWDAALVGLFVEL